jgi:thioesterase domain-containing protein
MGADRPFYGIQCVGLDGREEPFTDIESMAARYVAEIKRVQPVGPYYIGGYSFGGRVAFVMARMLRARGEAVPLLALLDASSRVGQRRPTLAQWLARHASRLRATPVSQLPAYGAQRFRNAASEIRRAALPRLYRLIIEHRRRRAREIPRWLRSPVEANDLIRRRTRLAPYEGDAVLFQTAESAEGSMDGKNGWSGLVLGTLGVVRVPGQHFQIVREPQVRDLAARLREAVDAAEAVNTAA